MSRQVIALAIFIIYIIEQESAINQLSIVSLSTLLFLFSHERCSLIKVRGLIVFGRALPFRGEVFLQRNLSCQANDLTDPFWKLGTCMSSINMSNTSQRELCMLDMYQTEFN